MNSPVNTALKVLLNPHNTAKAATALVGLPGHPEASVQVMVSSYEASGRRFCTLYACVEHSKAGVLEVTLPLKPIITDCSSVLQQVIRSSGFVDHVLKPLGNRLAVLKA